MKQIDASAALYSTNHFSTKMLKELDLDYKKIGKLKKSNGKSQVNRILKQIKKVKENKQREENNTIECES